MSTTQTTLHYTDRILTALALVLGAIALYQWGIHILSWTPTTMATALTWTLLTLVMFGIAGGVEHAKNRGE